MRPVTLNVDRRASRNLEPPMCGCTNVSTTSRARSNSGCFNHAMSELELIRPGGAVTDPFIQHVAESLLDSIELLTDEMVRRVIAQDPFFAQVSARSQDDVRADVKENLGQILRALAGHEPFDFDLVRSLARHRAEQGVPVAALLHAYRVAAQVLWDHHVAAGHLLGLSEFDLDQILDGAAQLWTLTNTYCSVISQVYDDNATDRARRSERTRTLLLDALLDGRTEDLPPLSEVSRLLDLPERVPFTVVIAEVLPPVEEGIPNVEHLLRRAGIRSTWRLFRQRQIGVVVVDEGDKSIATLCKLIAGRATTRVGLSPSYSDLTDTSRHVEMASLALVCGPADHVVVHVLKIAPWACSLPDRLNWANASRGNCSARCLLSTEQNATCSSKRCRCGWRPAVRSHDVRRSSHVTETPFTTESSASRFSRAVHSPIQSAPPSSTSHSPPLALPSTSKLEHGRR